MFGLHLLLAGIAMRRSRELPTLISILLIVAGVGYAFDSAMTIADIDTLSLGEFTLVWLLWTGFRLQKRKRLTPHGAPRSASPSDVVEPGKSMHQ
ncbi:DUF4386 family protein [Corynebacterium sp. L4756]|uniref:DUF4386 family protein n=1 Tax=Corynebacterium sp. L4756 TaxID=3373097 RepID=UPI00374D7A2E